MENYSRYNLSPDVYADNSTYQLSENMLITVLISYLKV
jgi:hypothetical protein